MIVVAPRCESGLDRLRRSARGGQAIDAAFAVEQKTAAIARPIRRFDEICGGINRAAIFGGDRDRLECADQPGCLGTRVAAREFDIRKGCFLESVVIVCANAQANVEWFIERESKRSACGAKAGRGI